MQQFIILCFICTLLSSCAANENSGGNTSPDYEGTKKMMVDMLQTDEGKKAVEELITEEEMQQKLVMDNNFVKETIQQTLTSEDGKKFWLEAMKDPEFAKTFAESMQAENEKILKGLMKDPEYQEMMMTILKDPEMEAAALELMQSKEYRQQVMTIMQESFESPLFVAKINEILMTVTAKHLDELTKQAESGGEAKKEEGGGEGGS
ncbi:spore germination lipoprotein GerD [Bacillus suaedae]|uniref:Spore gernimation protein GerD n=1 Tax=Halalkalibacter suaedae TaxID=2822140 RepID=A0A940WVB9_9BACI|nr:spore germination lipoprotein GerD [Bacillus suaedae]MBP3953449.1 spore gernimation protein GerD [Bacillus suaedae]